MAQHNLEGKVGFYIENWASQFIISILVFGAKTLNFSFST